MRRTLSPICLWLSCLLLCAAAETNDTVSAQPSAVSPYDIRQLSRRIKDCYQQESHCNTAGKVPVYKEMLPDMVEGVADTLKSGVLSTRTDLGGADEFSNTILVIIDPSNKKPIKQEKLANYIAGLCTVAIGNEANVLILDLTNFKEADKVSLKEIIARQFKAAAKNPHDSNGNKLDIDALLAERQINTIALIAEDPNKPQELTPIHSYDVRYTPIVDRLINKAHATYLSWKGIKAEIQEKESAVEKTHPAGDRPITIPDPVSGTNIILQPVPNQK